MKSVVTIDCHYIADEVACSYLCISEKGDAAFIETNTSRAVPSLMRALEENNVSPHSVRYIILTHVHLDHAAGTGLLLEKCPNATVICHPRAERHLVDPSRLIQSAEQVYGKMEFQKLYDVILPVDPHRIHSVEDDENLDFGTEKLRIMHTKGHANHHICISTNDRLFTGDSFGIAYPSMQNNGLCIFPSTTPTDFDAYEAASTIERLAALQPKTLYLTHFGPIAYTSEAKDQLLEIIAFCGRLVQELAAKVELTGVDLVNESARNLEDYFKNYYLCGNHPKLTTAEFARMHRDIQLNAQGIAWSAEKWRGK